MSVNQVIDNGIQGIRQGLQSIDRARLLAAFNRRNIRLPHGRLFRQARLRQTPVFPPGGKRCVSLQFQLDPDPVGARV